jgi:hypothetical protein
VGMGFTEVLPRMSKAIVRRSSHHSISLVTQRKARGLPFSAVGSNSSETMEISPVIIVHTISSNVLSKRFAQVAAFCSTRHLN